MKIMYGIHENKIIIFKVQSESDKSWQLEDDRPGKCHKRIDKTPIGIFNLHDSPNDALSAWREWRESKVKEYLNQVRVFASIPEPSQEEDEDEQDNCIQ